MLERTGIPTQEDIKKKTPDKKRLKKGPVAIVECFKEIPCDPCYHSCPFNSFAEFKDINDKPEIDFSSCTGCGVCIANCPGLAIFVVDYTFSEDRGIVRIPYEFLPLPEKGDEVAGLNREGEEVCRAIVEKVQAGETMDKTAVIWLSVPKDKLMDVRNMRVGE